jgi:hypothetical protein
VRESSGRLVVRVTLVVTNPVTDTMPMPKCVAPFPATQFRHQLLTHNNSWATATLAPYHRP